MSLKRRDLLLAGGALALLLAFTASADCRQDRRDRRVNRLRDFCGGESGPLVPAFQFAPDDGTGMGTVCACAAVTSANGEPLVFTRSSVATCTKGHLTTGIVPGDLVECGVDEPRVMPGGDGTGPLGLAVWESRTNTCIRSEEFDNAAVWLPINVAVAAPTVTADYALDPFGNMTADRIQIPAAGLGGTASYLANLTGCPTGGTGDHVASVYLMGTSGSGSVFIGAGNGFLTGGYTECAYVAGSYTRCELIITSDSVSAVFSIGTSPVEGTPTTPALDFIAWGAQCELGLSMSPFIPTAGTAATRAAETPSFDPQPIGSAGSVAATLIPEFNGDGGSAHVVAGGLFSNNFINALAQTVEIQDDNSNTVSYAPVGYPPLSRKRLYSYWSGSSMSVGSADAGEASGTFVAPMSTSALLVGRNGAQDYANGVIKQMCVDARPAVCR